MKDKTTAYLLDNGLLDEGQPTFEAHRKYTELMQAEFSPAERQLIRHQLGMLPVEAREES